jgi:hypothetical protein
MESNMTTEMCFSELLSSFLEFGSYSRHSPDQGDDRPDDGGIKQL